MKVKILIVEDDLDIQESLHLYITESRYQDYCHKSHNVQTALDKISEHEFDIILLDIILRGEFCTPIIVHARQRYQDRVLIVLMSAMRGATEFGNKLGIERVITKPFGVELIDEIIPIVL